jgi:predicted GTPase
MRRQRVVILGAAGRDFHDFNVLYRCDAGAQVVAFTAQQIPHIADRRYPAALAGHLYPEGIPIVPEEDLDGLIRREAVDLCVLAYSDLSHEEVMHLASRANAAGADFLLLAPERTMLTSRLPVVAVCASRTGAGKSQTARAVVNVLRAAGLRVAVLRHPMPYGDLAAQRVQRFATAADLEAHEVTIEEREEYEPHLAAGSVVWAGVDYEAILRQAEAEADVIVWDGGNNDTSFLRADLTITVVDPHRPGHELRYHPGETNVRLADVVIINKVDTAEAESVARVEANVRAVNPGATVLRAASPLAAEPDEDLAGVRVLAVEDGPTLTHGGMRYGAAVLYARAAGARLVDPRPWAVGEIAATLARHAGRAPLLPALGYGHRQVAELEATIARTVAEGGVERIVVGTPIDLSRIVKLPVPHVRVRYELSLERRGALEDALAPVLRSAVAFQAGAGTG